MDRYARKIHFDRLCSLREAYDRRGEEDAVAVIGIAAVIEWVNRELELDESTPPGPDADRSTSDR